MTEQHATVGMKVAFNYEKADLRDIARQGAATIGRNIDYNAMVQPLLQEVDLLSATLSRTAKEAAKALDALKSDLPNPNAVDAFAAELKSIVEFKEKFQASIASNAGVKLSVSSLVEAVEQLNTVATKANLLSNGLAAAMIALPSEAVVGNTAKALSELEKGFNRVQAAIVGINEAIAATQLVNQGIIQPTGQASPIFNTAQVAQLIDVSNSQIKAIKENSITNQRAADAFMAALAEKTTSGPLQTSSELLKAQLDALKASNEAFLDKFVIVDYETGAHKTTSPVTPGTERVTDGLELITSMAVKIGNGITEAFKVDYSQANYTTPFFDEYLAEPLKALPLKDFATEMHTLADIIRNTGRIFAGFNNKGFDNRVALENVKSTGDTELIDKWSAILAKTEDARELMLKLFTNALPRLTDDPDKDKFTLGTSLNGIRAIMLQHNTAHVAADDVEMTKNALVLAATVEGQKLFSDVMQRQGGAERWEGLVAALITDKYSYTKPLEALESSSDNAQYKAELLGLIKAARGLGNLTEPLMAEQNIPEHVIEEVLALQKAYAYAARQELQAYQDGIKASKEWIAQLTNQSAAGVNLVTNSVATVAAIDGLAETLKSLQKAFISQFADGVNISEFDRLTNPQNLKLNTETVGLDLDSFLNKFFLTLNSKLVRPLEQIELELILGRLKEVLAVTVDSMAQTAGTKHVPKLEADDISSQQLDAVMVTGKVTEDDINSTSTGTQIEEEYKKLELKLVKDANGIAFLSSAFVQGLETATNIVLSSAKLGLSPVITAGIGPVTGMAEVLASSYQNKLALESAKSSEGHDTTKYSYPASMFEHLPEELKKLREEITLKALTGGDLSIYGMTRQKRGNETEQTVIELLNSEEFAIRMMRETGQTFQLLDTQVRIAVGAFNYAIDALALIGGKLAVLEIKDTDKIEKLSEFMKNPAADIGKGWLSQGVMYREWIRQLTGQTVELYFVLVSMAEAAVKLTGDSIVTFKQIQGEYAADVKRITQQIITESHNAGKPEVNLATLQPTFEKPTTAGLITAKTANATQAAAMISISAGLVADDVIKFATLVQIALTANSNDLEKLYVKIHAAINAGVSTEISSAASKFFAISNFADAFNKLINLLHTFDGANTTTEKLQVVLSSYRSGAVPDTGFSTFTEVALSKVNALTGYQKALAEITSNLMKSDSKDTATLRSLISTLTSTNSSSISPEVEYIKTLEALVEPLKYMLSSARRMASKSGEVLPSVITALASYIDDLEKMQKEIPSKLSSARGSIAILLQDGSDEEALTRAQASLKAAFANQIAYLNALENFNKKGFGEAEQALRAFTLPAGSSTETTSVFIAQVNKLAKALAEAVFTPDLLGQLISAFKKTLIDAQSSLPKISFSDVTQKAITLEPGSDEAAAKALNKLLADLKLVGEQLQTQADLNVERANNLAKITTEEANLLVIEQNISKALIDRAAAEQAVALIISRQAELTTVDTGVSKAIAAALTTASEVVTKLAKNIFSPDLFNEILAAYKTALRAGMANLPGVSFSEVSQQALSLYQGDSSAQLTNLSKVIIELTEIGNLLDQQVAKNLAIEQSALRQAADLESQTAIQQRLNDLAKARADVTVGMRGIATEQAAFQARLTTGGSGGSGGSVPPTGNLPVPYTGDSKPVGGVNWDELSKQYTKSIASISLQTSLYGESLDLLRGKSSAADAELKRIIGLLGTHIGNKFLTEEEIGFKNLSKDIQDASAQLEHFQKMASQHTTAAADLGLKSRVAYGMGDEVNGAQFGIQARASLNVAGAYQEEYNKLREKLANSEVQETLKAMGSELGKIFNGKIDFGSTATLEQAQTKLKDTLKISQENLMQKAVDNFAKILESTFSQETLTSQLKINTEAFKTGTTSMPRGNPADLLGALNRVDLGTLPTRTGEMFDASNMKAALEAIVGMEAGMRSLATGSTDVDKIIKNIVADSAKLLTASAGTGSSSVLAKEFLAAEQAVQKTVVEAKNLEAVYKNLQEQLAAIDTKLKSEVVTEEELTTLARERVKVETAITSALEQQAGLASRVKSEITATVEAGKKLSIDVKTPEGLAKAQAEAKVAGTDKIIKAEEDLVKRKIQLQGELEASLDKGLQADKKLVSDLIKINSELQSMGVKVPGKSSADLQTLTKEQDSHSANTKFATDIIDFAVWQVEWAAAANIVQGFFGAIQEGIKTVIEFESVVHKMAVISQASSLETKQLGMQMLELSKVSPYSVKELGEGLIVLGQAGFNATEAMALLPSVANLATASLETLKVAADIVTTAIEAYQLKLSEGAKVADIMNATAIESKLDLAQVGTAFNYVASTAATAGISVADTTTALGLMSNAGLKASTAGTALRSTLGAMMSPTAAFATQLAKVGLSAEDVNPRLHSLGDILGRMRESGFNVENAFAGLDKRMAAGLITLVNQSDQWVTFKDKIENGTTAAEQAEKQMYTFENSTKALTHSLQAVAVSAGESVLTPMALLARALQFVVDGFTALLNVIPESLKEFVLVTAGVGIAVSAINAFRAGLAGIVTAKTAMAEATKAAAAAEVLMSTATTTAETSKATAAVLNAARQQAALSGTTKTVVELREKLGSLSAVFLNPTMWGWVATATAVLMAGKAMVDQVSGTSAVNTATESVGKIEAQLKTVKALTADLQRYNPEAAVNTDIQQKLRLAGFDIDVKNLDKWIENMSSMFQRLSILQQEAELVAKTNTWTDIMTSLRGLLNPKAIDEAAAIAASSGAKVLKSKRGYYDDSLFEKTLDTTDFGKGEVGKRAQVEIHAARSIAKEEDPDWDNKLIAERQQRVKESLARLKAGSIREQILEDFTPNLIDPTDKEKKYNEKGFERAYQLVKSTGIDIPNEVSANTPAMRQEFYNAAAGKAIFDPTIKAIDAAEAAEIKAREEIRKQLVEDAQGLGSSGTITSNSEAFINLSKNVLNKINEFAKLKQDLVKAQADLDAVLGDQNSTEEQIAVAKLTVASLMRQIEDDTSAQVRGLVKFFENKLVNELGSQLQKMVKGLAPIAFVNDTTLSKEAGGVSLQEQEGYYSKLQTIQEKTLKMKNSISNSMRLEIGSKAAEAERPGGSLILNNSITPDPKRLDVLLKTMATGPAYLQAQLEARGEAIIEQKITLWQKLRAKDATDEAQLASAANAKKYLDIAQKAADDATANKAIELNFNLSSRSFNSTVETELGLTTKTMQNFSASTESFTGSIQTSFNRFHIPTFSEAQKQLAKLETSFANTQDGIVTQYQVYQNKMKAIADKEKSELSLLDNSGIAKSSDASSLYQQRLTQITLAGATARSEAMRSETTNLQSGIQAQIQSYSSLINIANSARQSGLDSANFWTQLGNSIIPNASLSMEDLKRQVKNKGLEMVDAAGRDDKAAVSALQNQVSGLIASGGEATKGDKDLKDLTRRMALSTRDAFEDFENQTKRAATRQKDTAVGNLQKQQGIGVDLNKDTFQQIAALNTKQIDAAVSRVKEETAAIISVPDTIAQATQIASNNLIELGITFKSVAEQAEILGAKMKAANEAGGGAVNAQGTPISAKNITANDIKLSISIEGAAPKGFEFSSDNMSRITDAVVTRMTSSLQE